MPPEIAGALSTLIGAIATVLLWWGSSTFGPGSRRDRHDHHDDDD